MTSVVAASEGPSSGGHIVELVIAGVLAALGTRSLVHWLRVRFSARDVREHLMFAAHVTARVGTWFALGAIFVGYALLAEPQRYRWFLVVIPALAGVQLLTAAWLGLGGGSRETPAGGRVDSAPPDAPPSRFDHAHQEPQGDGR